jgi:hypothetical protein
MYAASAENKAAQQLPHHVAIATMMMCNRTELPQHHSGLGGHRDLKWSLCTQSLN